MTNHTEWNWAQTLADLTNTISNTLSTIEDNGSKPEQFLAIALAHVFKAADDPHAALREVYEMTYNVLVQDTGNDPAEEQPSPEDVAAIEGFMNKVDAAVNEGCATMEDQIGVLLTHILIRIAKMTERGIVKDPRREISKISSAMRHEWRAYQRLVDQQAALPAPRPSGRWFH